MGLVDHLDHAVDVAEEEGVLGRRHVVVGVGVPAPRQVAGTPAVVGAAVVGLRHERLLRAVGYEDGDAARAAVDERGRDRPAQVDLIDHVVHRVVQEHGVEAPAEAHGAHVALLVLAAGVAPPRQVEHRFREVHQRQVEPGGEMRRVVPAAAAQLEDLAHRDRRGFEEHRREGGLLGVLLDR